MGTRGPKRAVDPGTVYAFAHQFYWDFRHLAEGGYRWRLDEEKYKKLVERSEKVQLSDEEKAHLKQYVEEEVQAGRLKEAEKDARLRDLEEGGLFVERDWRRRRAAEDAGKQLRIPGEPEVLKALLRAKTPEQVRRICRDAFGYRKVEVAPGVTKPVRVRNWPISSGSVLPLYLSQYASEFIIAKTHRRFPRSTRPSNQLKQLWFLSRALAGALFGIKTRTAINLVGSRRPEQIFEESRAAKPTRKKRRQR